MSQELKSYKLIGNVDSLLIMSSSMRCWCLWLDLSLHLNGSVILRGSTSLVEKEKEGISCFIFFIVQ